MNALCPSDYQLEAVLLDPKGLGHAEHILLCESCTARIKTMQVQGAVFEEHIYPRLRSRIPQQAPARRPWWALSFGLVPAAAAALFFVHPTPTTQTKGDTCGLSVLLEHDGMVAPVDADGIVPAGATLRFRPHFGTPRSVLVLSADQPGEISRIYPQEGKPVQLEKSDMLPGGALLDGQAGPERLFVFCGEEGMSTDAIESAVRSAVAPGRARDLTHIEGLPAGVNQGTVLLEKVP